MKEPFGAGAFGFFSSTVLDGLQKIAPTRAGWAMRCRSRRNIVVEEGNSKVSVQTL